MGRPQGSSGWRCTARGSAARRAAWRLWPRGPVYPNRKSGTTVIAGRFSLPRRARSSRVARTRARPQDGRLSLWTNLRAA